MTEPRLYRHPMSGMWWDIIFMKKKTTIITEDNKTYRTLLQPEKSNDRVVCSTIYCCRRCRYRVIRDTSYRCIQVSARLNLTDVRVWLISQHKRARADLNNVGCNIFLYTTHTRRFCYTPHIKRIRSEQSAIGLVASVQATRR